IELIENETMQVRYLELMELQELRNQAQVKSTFEKKEKIRVFQEGDIVLKWDKDREMPGNHTKFDSIWSGPYMILACKQHNFFQLVRLNREELPIPVN
ncbi:hypothetical protein KI387_007848, partial [Taxus chinensis]